jgi:hypothetical protein
MLRRVSGAGAAVEILANSATAFNLSSLQN